MGRTVLASGVFDIIHEGHIRYLTSAKRLAGRGGSLVVVVARDDTARRTKGKGPIFSERERAFIVSSLKSVDEVLLGYRDPDLKKAFRKTILAVNPDVIAVGYDQARWARLSAQVLHEMGVEVRFVRIRKFRSKRIRLSSSSRIKRRIARLEAGGCSRRKR